MNFRNHFLDAAGTTLGVGAAVIAGIAVAYAIRAVGAPAQPAEAAFTLPEPPAPYIAPVQAARLDAAVVFGGSRFGGQQPIALPTGSAFEVELWADRAGHARVYAVNPAGETTHIWSGMLQPGDAARTRRLRLEGLRGMEQVRVVFRADSGAEAPVVRQLRILHV